MDAGSIDTVVPCTFFSLFISFFSWGGGFVLGAHVGEGSDLWEGGKELNTKIMVI